MPDLDLPELNLAGEIFEWHNGSAKSDLNVVVKPLAEQLGRVEAQIAAVEQFQPSDILFQEGAACDRTYLVVEGLGGEGWVAGAAAQGLVEAVEHVVEEVLALDLGGFHGLVFGPGDAGDGLTHLGEVRRRRRRGLADGVGDLRLRAAGILPPMLGDLALQPHLQGQGLAERAGGALGGAGQAVGLVRILGGVGALGEALGRGELERGQLGEPRRLLRRDVERVQHAEAVEQAGTSGTVAAGCGRRECQ